MKIDLSEDTLGQLKSKYSLDVQGPPAPIEGVTKVELEPVSERAIQPSAQQRQIPDQPEGVFTGREYFEQADIDPIIQQVRQTPEYLEASEANKPFIERKALEQANIDLYRRQGEPVFELGPLALRTQQAETPEGEKRTYIVPRGDDPLARTIAGGLMEGLRSTLQLGQWLLATKGLRQVDANFIQENFPRMPVDSPTEKTIQEILSMVTGGLGGAGVAAKIDRTVGISKKIVGLATRQWEKLRKVDPKHASEKLEMFVRAAVIETGANIGATVTTPENVEPLLGQLITGEQIPTLSEEETTRVAHFFDNTAFSVGVMGLTRLFGGAKKLGGYLFGGFNRLNIKEKQMTTEVALQTLRLIDPNITPDAPLEQIMHAAQNMGEVAQKHKEFNVSVFGEGILPEGKIDLNTTTALQLGAKEYIENTYGWRKAHMDPAEYARTVEQEASQLITNMISMKQSRQGQTIVSQSDAAIAAQAGDIFTEEAGLLATVGESARLGEDIARPLVSDVVSAKETLRQAGAGRRVAEEALTTTQRDDALLAAIEQARNTNALGSTTAERTALEKLSGPQLLEAFTTSRKGVNEAFDNLPTDIPVDVNALVDQLQNISAKEDVLSLFTFLSPEAQMPIMSDEIATNLMSKIRESTLDLKSLYKDVRKALAGRINEYAAAGKNSDQLQAFSKYIDELAEKSGDPRFSEAMDKYRIHVDTWEQTDALRRYSTVAKKVTPTAIGPISGKAKGEVDAYEAGARLIEEVFTAKTADSRTALLTALEQGGDDVVSQEIGEMYVALAIKDLASNVQGETVSSSQIRQAIQPYLTVLEKTNPDAVRKFANTVENLQMAESGVISATKAESDALIAHTEIMTATREKIASKFISDLSNAPEALQDANVVFTKIFNDSTAPNLVNRLMIEAQETGNPLLIDGIKAQFIRYVRDRAFTSKRLGVEATGAPIRESSAANLARILEGSNDNTLTTMRVIFKDEPKKADAIEGLLSMLNLAVNARAYRPTLFGSSTPVDNELQKSINRVIMITLGILNPAATRARTFTTALTSKYNASLQDAMMLQLDNMIADPVYFSQAMKLLSEDSSGNTVKEYINMIMRATGKGVMGERKEQSVDEQTEDVFTSKSWDF